MQILRCLNDHGDVVGLSQIAAAIGTASLIEQQYSNALEILKEAV